MSKDDRRLVVLWLGATLFCISSSLMLRFMLETLFR